MNGTFYIDGIDAYEEYGIWITNGGYNDFLIFPELAEPVKNDWPEEDGVEVDLENPVLKPKEVAITFVSHLPFKSSYDFIKHLLEPGYHTFHIPALDREWRLRLLSHPDNKEWGEKTSLTLTFAEDLPDRPDYINSFIPGVFIPKSDYELDDISFDRYGIVVEDGLDAVLKSPTVKQNLSRIFSGSDGRLYDVGMVVLQPKDVTLKCVMVTDSLEHFWQCYDAFFHALIQPGERKLFCIWSYEEYPCYYKKCSGVNIVNLGKPIVVEFNLTLAFTVFRTNEKDYFLATESDELIVTEDNEFYIDLKE